MAATLAAAAPPSAAPYDPDGMMLAQVTIEQRVIVRVPLRAPPLPPGPPPVAWREKGAGHCIRLDDVAGAAIVVPGGVDLVLRGGGRMRAWLASECPALDYYGGFYVAPGADGMVCAGRDAIHARSGGECQIDRFRRLRPVMPRRVR